VVACAAWLSNSIAAAPVAVKAACRMFTRLLISILLERGRGPLIAIGV
jgi:hypothetical protein